jgi:hypothetical protein
MVTSQQVPENTTGVNDQIMNDPGLSSEQKQRISAILNEVHQAYLHIDNALDETAPHKGYQLVNWRHTRGEVDQVLLAAKVNQLTPEQTEDALLASIFSDSIKTPDNFLVHNVDGAESAAKILKRYFAPEQPEHAERIEGIVRAVMEHQIGPPLFMATTLSESIKLSKGGSLSPSEELTLAQIVIKIAEPFAHTTSDGSEIDFTDAEREMLSLFGIKHWYVPHKDSPWYLASRTVIDGDSLINYASPGGWAKIAAIRGPGKGPLFQDATIFDSLDSARLSYEDAYTVISETAKPLAEAGLQRTQAALQRVRNRVLEWLEQQTDTPYNSDGTLPFWDTPLSYPSESALSALEQEQFEFAKRIREQVVQFLLAEE